MMFSYLVSASLLVSIAAMTTPPVVATPSAQQHAAASTDMSLHGQTLLRCSAAFAMVSYGQSVDNTEAMKWPALGERGKEFFVRAMAQLMDETGQSRQEISHWVSAEAQRLSDTGTVNDVMPACLLMLETSDL